MPAADVKGVRAERSHRAGFLLAFVAAAATAAAGCAQRGPLGTVNVIGVRPAAAISAASAGLDGRLWFAIDETGALPIVVSEDVDGRVRRQALNETGYAHAIGDIAAEPDHTVWVTLPCDPPVRGCASGYARVGGRAGAMTSIRSLGAPDAASYGVALTPDGQAWMAIRNRRSVVRVSRDGRVTELRLPARAPVPDGIVVGPRGTLDVWGMEPGRFVEIDQLGRARVRATPDRASHLTNFAAGPDGRVWFGELEADKIVAYTPGGGFAEYRVPTSNAEPAGVAVDAAGVWFIEYGARKIGKIDALGRVSEAPLSDDSGQPLWVFAGPQATLMVVGLRPELLGLTRSWTVTRIPEGAISMGS